MNLSLLTKTSLFRGMTSQDISSILNCLEGQYKTYTKGELIYCAGEFVHSIGIVLSGKIHIEIDDFWGNKSILNDIQPGQLFAEAYACVPGEPLMVNVVSVTNSEILFLNIHKMVQTCSNSCIHHSKMIQNLLTVMAQKNLHLSRRILHTTPKTIRDRLLAYLSFLEFRQGSRTLTVPFNRQQLADYLSVDRSALSKEIGKMQKDGILKVRKNIFVIKSNPL